MTMASRPMIRQCRSIMRLRPPATPQEGAGRDKAKLKLMVDAIEVHRLKAVGGVDMTKYDQAAVGHQRICRDRTRRCKEATGARDAWRYLPEFGPV